MKGTLRIGVEADRSETSARPLYWGSYPAWCRVWCRGCSTCLVCANGDGTERWPTSPVSSRFYTAKRRWISALHRASLFVSPQMSLLELETFGIGVRSTVARLMHTFHLTRPRVGTVAGGAQLIGQFRQSNCDGHHASVHLVDSWRRRLKFDRWSVNTSFFLFLRDAVAEDLVIERNLQILLRSHDAAE